MFNYFSLSNEDWTKLRIDFTKNKLKVRVICKSDLYLVSKQPNSFVNEALFLKMKNNIFSKRFVSLLFNKCLYSNLDINSFNLLNINLFNSFINSTITTICLGENEYAKSIFNKYTTFPKNESVNKLTCFFLLYKKSSNSFVTLVYLLYMRLFKLKLMCTCYLLSLLIYKKKSIYCL